MNPRKEIIFISNPFGYGPTGTMISVLNEAIKHWKDCDFYLIGNDLCTEIVNPKSVKIISLDQRDYKELENCLRSFKNPYLISTLNYFGIATAKKLKIPNAFVDTIVWMWEKIPEYFLLTDHYFALNFPGVKEKIKSYPNIKLVSYTTDICTKNLKRKGILFHIGGAKNPYTGLQTKYLTLLGTIFNNLIFKEEVTFATSKEAIAYLNKIITNKKIKFKTFLKKDFDQKLKTSQHFITTAGSTASIQAFSCGTPTSFLLSWNLCQWKILKIFKEQGIGCNSMNWNKLLKRDLNSELKDLSEIEAFKVINNFIDEVLNNKDILQSITNNLQNNLSNIPDTIKQDEFIKKTGHEGAKEIIQHLTNIWDINSVHKSV